MTRLTSWVQCWFLIPQSSFLWKMASSNVWCAYPFSCHGKIFHSATRRELFFSRQFWILSWRSPQCGFDGNSVPPAQMSCLFIYPFLKCPVWWREKSQSIFVVCFEHIRSDVKEGTVGFPATKTHILPKTPTFTGLYFMCLRKYSWS